MYLKVEYYREFGQAGSACWSFLPLGDDLEEATSLARDGMADVSSYLGATGFRILDRAGSVVAQEAMQQPKLYS
jgi:hypothetical protein